MENSPLRAGRTIGAMEVPDTETELRRLLDAGDGKAALALVHAAWGGTVQRLVRALPTREQSEDISQEIWIAVQQSLPAFKWECPPRAWLVRVAKNTIADFWRRRSRQFDHFQPDDPVLETLVTQFAGKSPTNESVVDRTRRLTTLRAALEQLDPEERDILWDRFVLQIPPADIARERSLGRSANAVSQQIHRLTERLRSVLAS